MEKEIATDQLTEVVDMARLIAKDYMHATYSSCHLLKSVLRKEQGLVPFLDSMTKDVGYMREWADMRIEAYPKSPNPVSAPGPDKQIDAVLREADFVRMTFGRNEVDGYCLLTALCTPGVGFSYEQLKSFPITRQEIMEHIDAPKLAVDGGSSAAVGSVNGNGQNDNKAIAAYCIDKVELAAQGKIDPIVGRDKEVRMMTEILGRRSKPNVIILGDPGVGKTALVEGFALNIQSGDVPERLKGSRLFELDLGSLVAGASYKGEVEDRIKKVMNAIKTYDKAILFIDEIHALMDESRGLTGCADLLKPELARGEITVIGATTKDEYREFLESEAAFMRRFEIIQVDEPTDRACKKMLQTVIPIYEKHHGIQVEEKGLDESIRLSRRYLKERRLPDAAIDLLDRTLASIRMMNDTSAADIVKFRTKLDQVRAEDEDAQMADLRQLHAELTGTLSPVLLGQLNDEVDVETIEEGSALRSHLRVMLDRLAVHAGTAKTVVDKEDIAAVVSHKTGIPLGKVQSQEKERLLGIEETLKKRVVGQDHAIKILGDAILESRSGLNKAGTPIGSFFFLGPTGTGKTELAKALAEFLFADENSLIRFDMSEFKEEHSAALLYGAPPGYVGYKEGGLLVTKIRQQPYAIVLFDEIEKAHPSVFDLFLQILDEGKLHDRLGREGDFSNAVVLFTSNIGSDHIISEFTEGRIPVSADLLEIMSSHFRPEFLGRLTEILPFRPINEETVETIFSLQLKQLESALEKQNIFLTLTPGTRRALALEGFTPRYGARPLRAVIRNRLRRPISRMIISQQVTKGQTIVANMKDGDLELNVQNPNNI